MNGLKQEQNKMVKPPSSFWWRMWEKLDIHKPSTYLFLLHVLCIFAPFHFNWGAFWVTFSLHIITTSSISISYHRNLAHKSFRLPKWLEYLLAYCAAHAFQGDPISWVSIHRCHHRYVDTERDPHSPIQGFLFSHITWLFDLHSLNKKVCSKYLSDSEEKESYIYMVFFKQGNPDNVTDLENQSFYRFLQKTYVFHAISLAVLFYGIGGVPLIIWGMCVRIVVTYHVTFMVNSVCHIWGNRQWNTNDLSKNNWWVAIITFGEGWHNNHHAFEYSARHGLEWWQIDFGWYFIMFLRAIRLATDVKSPSSKAQSKVSLFRHTKIASPKLYN